MARQRLGTVAGPRNGLSPHAPYTVCTELLDALVGLSASDRVPLAMHLAESQEELELLRHGAGPLKQLLQDREAWNPKAIRPGSRPLDYLRTLSCAHRAIVVHGNYLDEEEIAFVAANATKMCVVYCPRSHDWFGHTSYPLEKMLAAGAVVALGTDGRGSNPDLSLLAEMRRVACKHPSVDRRAILAMGTLNGANALGIDGEVGSIEPNKDADLTVVALPNRDARDPHELLLDSAEPVIGCYCRGLSLSPDLPNRRSNSSSTSKSDTLQNESNTRK
jgi:aminodeoxyfutalosine deaminase